LILPYNPQRTESRGGLRIDYFPSSPERPIPAALITNDVQFLLLTGSATLVANDLVDTYISLTGPPDILQRLRGNATNQAVPCGSDVLRFDRGSSASGAGVRRFLLVHPGADSAAFKRTGFLPGDVITAVNGRPVANEDLFDLLRQASAGRQITLSIERGDAQSELVLRPENARVAFENCTSP